jgi:hypothetical protein
VKRCYHAGDSDAVARCRPFSDRGPTTSECVYYAGQTRVISKRRLGGVAVIDN